MIKSISYDRKNSLLSEENPRNRYISFVVEKNQTYLVEVTLVPFIAPEVPPFRGRGKGSHINQISLSCQDKISLTYQSKISLTH